MRTISPALQAAINAIVTSPGHLIWIDTKPNPILWSDIGQVTMFGRTYYDVDLKIGSVAFSGDQAPGQITLRVTNLDSSIGALLLANDLSSIDVYLSAFDRAVPDESPGIGRWRINTSRIGIDFVTMNMSPLFYTAPFRRIDAPNGFNFATPAGRQIKWGSESLILDRLNPWYYQ